MVVPLPPDFLASSSRVIEYRDRSFAHVFLSVDEKWRIATTVDDVDPRYLEALIRLEDRRFRSHGGVDMLAIVRAGWTNLTRGHIVSGASTITMQLVRVREPRPRTLGSKLIEVYRAWQVEARFRKDEILGLYLTYVPYGRNIEGIEAASLAYFGHRPRRLSPDEIATLLAVPQNPSRRYPSPSNRARLRRARDDLAARLTTADPGSGIGEGGASRSWLAPSRDGRAVLEEVRRARVVARLLPFPRHALHASYWLRRRDPAQRVETTLDRGIQKTAQTIMQHAASRLSDLGIHNGAAVVVDHATAEVRGLVGNFDFWDARHAGQIPGFARARSPGSALKPFLYALAIDRGQVLPEHRVPDVPQRFGTYAPKNYDGRFSGLVRLEDALARSLNVPFVDMLADLGIEAFIGHLETWGVQSLVDDPGFYGLSAAIGGLEMTPLELAGLYTILARNGRYRGLRVQPGPTDERPAFAPGTAYLTQRALRLRDRPDFPSRYRWSGVPPQVHWKTGTSYGHRDAWAAGSDDRFTVVVWLGNFDNTPSRHLVGADAAGPIMFDMLEALSTGRPPVPPPPPPTDLSRIEVCRFSGRRPTRACPHRDHVWALTQHAPTASCAYHRVVDVDLQTGLALRPGCRQGRPFQTRSFLQLPAKVRRWLDAHRRDLPAPPSWADGCAPSTSDHAAPAITSPAVGQVALLIPGVPADRQEIPLEAESRSARLSWFIDGRFLGTVKAGAPLWWPPAPGTHEVVVVDETGASGRRRFRVQ